MLRYRVPSRELSLVIRRLYSANSATPPTPTPKPTTTKKESASTANLSIATKQKLYMIDANSPGSAFFLPHGTKIFNKLVKFMKTQQAKQNFTEVITPLIFKKTLWEISGHWENYKEDMFKVESNDTSKLGEDELNTVYGLKPMNCPGHCLVFDRFSRSHNELPLRLSDWSSLHRNESSGSLTGLTRVRRFHQDDGHIFCTSNQIKSEITDCLNLIKLVYSAFGFTSYKWLLSTRPEDHYIGELSEWNKAESELKSALDTLIGENKWELNPGDGAFYGPKIDVKLTDNFNKEHQVATIQLDFQLPQRFKLKYQSEHDTLETPIMIHRAIFGSVERFLAMLIDHYNGKWPFWLSPRQAVIIPVNSSHIVNALKVKEVVSNELSDRDYQTLNRLTEYKFDVDIDDRAETVGFRTKDAISKGYNYIIVIGDKEVETGNLAIRSRESRKLSYLRPEEIHEMFKNLENEYK